MIIYFVGLKTKADYVVLSLYFIQAVQLHEEHTNRLKTVHEFYKKTRLGVNHPFSSYRVLHLEVLDQVEVNEHAYGSMCGFSV